MFTKRWITAVLQHLDSLEPLAQTVKSWPSLAFLIFPFISCTHKLKSSFVCGCVDFASDSNALCAIRDHCIMVSIHRHSGNICWNIGKINTHHYTPYVPKLIIYRTKTNRLRYKHDHSNPITEHLLWPPKFSFDQLDAGRLPRHQMKQSPFQELTKLDIDLLHSTCRNPMITQINKNFQDNDLHCHF